MYEKRKRLDPAATLNFVSAEIISLMGLHNRI